MSMRMACMARRSRMAAVSVASPRKRPQSLSAIFEVTAVETVNSRLDPEKSVHRGVSREVAGAGDIA